MTDSAAPPVRVERILRLLPDVDAITPLRGFVIAKSWLRRPPHPDQTVGKRYVDPVDLRQLIPRMVAQAAEHLVVLYEAAVGAMEAEQRGDLPAAVRFLLEAGDRDRDVGRRHPARAWYEQALRIAEGLRDRGPEIHTLLAMGGLDLADECYEPASRRFQRSFALAEAEEDRLSAALACRRLGETALAQARWDGAISWFARARHFANGDDQWAGEISIGEGTAAFGRGALSEAAVALDRARELFTAADDGEGLARTLRAKGRLYRAEERRAEALACFVEGLARMRIGRRDPALEVGIRLDLCALYADWGRTAEAEDQLRRAEETAIVHNLTRELARVYLALGTLRGQTGDEAGFVFFEKAVELCRGPEPLPRLEADVYLEYARFRERFGDGDEARAYLERAQEIVADLADEPGGRRVGLDLARLRPD